MASDTTHTDTPPPAGRRRRFRSLMIPVAMAICLVAGFVAGTAWHGRHTADTDGAAPRRLWTCGMHPQVIQDKPGACPICGMTLEPLSAGGDAPPAGTERKIKYWWDPMMNPPYISEKPGKSPMGMDLVPVYDDQVSGGTAITIDPVVVQNMGVRVTRVKRGPLRQSIRAVGYLEQPQPGIHDINMRVSGWIERLYGDTEGMLLKKDQPLFELYSPDVQTAIEELIIARKAAEAAAGTDEPSRQTSDVLMQAAFRKLEQWGLQPPQIEELARLDRAPRTVEFLSPATGEVAEKMVVSGSMIKMGERAMQILDRSTLWLDAQVYSQDLPLVRLGQEASAVIESMPGQSFKGQVVFINPSVNAATRTTTVRMALDNPELALRPGMFATVEIQTLLVEDALLIPREAVLDTGTRQVVFVSLPGGHFEPRNVTLGGSGESGNVQVLGGLAPEELVVVSGQFLLDAESRMKEAIQKLLGDKLVKKAPTTSPASMPHTGHAVAAKVSPGWQNSVDATVAAYLKLSAALGAVQAQDTPLDVTELLNAASALRDNAADPTLQPLAEQVLKAAEPLAGQPLARQRELFKQLSDALISLVEESPPTRKVASKLYVLYCPMAPGHWLQDSSQGANPYYATEMKQCAELIRTIEAAGE